MPVAKQVVVATAGHVDHGKSTLVKALTGIEPDRLAEEQRRGLTIDLGFAWMDLPSSTRLGIVDVPGHSRFIKNMIAGVGGVDACLFVVDAAEGWMPQSEEHLRILEMVGVARGVLALTKCDRLDDGELLRVEARTRSRLIGTFLEQSALVQTSARTNRGLRELVRELDRTVALVAPSPAHRRARLWVDRSFSIKGTGTVVTGTLLGGPFTLGDEVELTLSEPAPGRPVLSTRIRSMQSHDQNRHQVFPGSRVALGLHGVPHHEISRGDCVTHRERWHRTKVMDAAVTVLGARNEPVQHRGAYLAYIGCSAYRIDLRLIGSAKKTAIAPGETGLARLRIDVALPLEPGDRFVLRDSGRDELVGGGTVLDISPVLPVSRAKPDLSIQRVIDERGRISPDQLERLTGERWPPTVGDWILADHVVGAAEARMSDAIRAEPLGLNLASLDELDRAVLETMDDVSINNGWAQRREDTDALDQHPVLEVLRANPFCPSLPSDVDAVDLAALVRRGSVLSCDGLYFARSAIDLAARRLRDDLATVPEGLTLSEIRISLGVSRKYALPLAQLLDRCEYTRRRGDRRLPGSELARL